jgi:hypothetical protein
MLQGPFGSGKSTAVVMDILYASMVQTPAPDGVRYTRWGVVRKTYPNLKDTTRRLLVETLPPEAGSVSLGNAPLTGVYQFGLPDRTSVHMELVLWALEDERSLVNIRSANWTGAWLNETTELPFEVLENVMGRIGRYPSKSMGGCTWSGVLMDFNPYPAGHWLSMLVNSTALTLGEKSFPIETFTQPPAAFRVEHEDGTVTYEVNANAENLENLRGGVEYYETQIALRLKGGKTEEVEELFCMLPPKVRKGKVVWPSFSPERHVARAVLQPFRGQPVVVGFDTSGLHPAAVVAQLQYGRWCVLDELFGFELGLELFLTGVLIPFFTQKYPGSEVVVSCDPANARDSWTAVAPTEHLKNARFQVFTPAVNRVRTRIDSVAAMLNKDYGGLMISPNCANLIEAMNGGYHYTRHRLRGSVDVVYSNEPAKNEHSHIADALQYLALHVNRKGDEPEKNGLRELVGQRNARRRGVMRAA